MVQGVVRDAEDGAGGEMVAVDPDAAGEDLAWEEAADGRREAEAFVEAGAQVGGLGEEGAGADGGEGREGAADAGR